MDDLNERQKPADISPLIAIMARLRDPERGCAFECGPEFASHRALYDRGSL